MRGVIRCFERQLMVMCGRDVEFVADVYWRVLANPDVLDRECNLREFYGIVLFKSWGEAACGLEVWLEPVFCLGAKWCRRR